MTNLTMLSASAGVVNADAVQLTRCCVRFIVGGHRCRACSRGVLHSGSHLPKLGQVVSVDWAQFLTPAQVSAVVDATSWPYNVLVHVAAWAGLARRNLAGSPSRTSNCQTRHSTPTPWRNHAYSASSRPREPTAERSPMTTRAALIGCCHIFRTRRRICTKGSVALRPRRSFSCSTLAFTSTG